MAGFCRQSKVLTMTPKERMLSAISHEEPDRVPIGEWEFGREVVEPVLGRRTLFPRTLETIKAYWNKQREQVVNDWKEGLVELTLKLNWDAVLVHLAIGKNTPIDVPEQIDNNKWRDNRGRVLFYSHETDKMCIIKKAAPDFVSPEVGPQPSAAVDPEPEESELEVVRYIVKALGKTHLIFSAPLLGHPKLSFSDMTSGGEVENWVRLYEDPDAFLERNLAYIRKPDFRLGLEIAKWEGIDAIAGSNDFGTNSGPFMSPDMFKKYILPTLAEYSALIHSYGLLNFLHSCGNNQVLMDMIVEAGIDVYQSIQPEMDIIKMKKRYGKNITLWGGIPPGDLVTSTPAEVELEAKKYLDACKPGGGYIFATGHSIMPGAKYENYQAMLTAHRKYGNY